MFPSSPSDFGITLHFNEIELNSSLEETLFIFYHPMACHNKKSDPFLSGVKQYSCHHNTKQNLLKIFFEAKSAILLDFSRQTWINC